MQEHRTVIDLGAAADAGIGLVGGKAATLGALLAADFPVPDGFCVPTTAYRDAVRVDDVVAELDRTPPDDGATLARLAAVARSRIRDAPVPAAVADAYTALGDGVPVAVRSSATTEDLPDASFAGQHDTVLGVVGVPDLRGAVRACWASLFSERAVLYRAAHGVDHARAEIAVVVQRMVDAERAGVLFTADPTTGSRSEMVVESVAGLGETLVDGSARPERHVLGPGGACVRDDGVLGRARLRELWSTGRCLECHLGGPQDVEWALDRGGRLWITQSRPVTTLFPVPDPLRARPRVYWSLNAYQGLNRPFTPIGAHLVRLRQMAFQPGLVASGIAAQIPDVDGWLYWDVTDGAYSADRRARLAALVDAFTAPAGQALLDHADELEPDGGVDPLANVPPRRLSPDRARAAFAILFPGTARARILVRSERLVRRHVGPTTATPGERLDWVERHAPPIARIELDLPREHGARWAAQLAAGLLRDVADETELNAVFRGVPGNPTTEMDLALWRLAVRIRGDEAAQSALVAAGADAFAAGTLPTTLQDGLAAFLRAYGSRVSGEIDLGVPRWSDDPTPVLALLRTYVASTDPEQDAERRFAQAARAAERSLAELVARLPRRQWPRRLLAAFLLRRCRALRGLREHGKSCLMRGFAALRVQLLAVGDELAGRGLLGRAQDAVFLVPDELRAGLRGDDLRAVVERRRDAYRRECARPRVPSLVRSDGTALEPRRHPADRGGSAPGGPHRTAPDRPDGATDRAGAGAELSGLAGSAGAVTAAARVVTDPGRPGLCPGEILVVASTDPGWTPLFLTAGALVSETGGMTSHGTTVAREYGIPAVVGVPDATRLIRTGDRVTVDGSAGTVTVHGGPA